MSCKHSDSDTIAALATAPGAAGVAVVRITGADCYQVADRILSTTPPPSRRRAGTFVYCGLRDLNGNSVDSVVALFFRAPASYTREDVVEIQGHGGRASAARLLQTVLSAGARHAEPGEFTKRAFINGRIDLVQAEAVADLIRAESDRAATAAQQQLQGDLSACFAGLYQELLQLHADMTALLDFEQDDVPQAVLHGLLPRLRHLSQRISQALKTRHEGHLLRDGVDVVISGRPNAGKSTLMNALLGCDRAIVSDQPGTTRDTIEESVVIDGIVVRLTDTAGLRDTDCQIESEGIARAHTRIEAAHVNLHVIDSSRSVESRDIDFINNLPQSQVLVVLSKADIAKEEAFPDLRHEIVQGSLHDPDFARVIRAGILDIIHAASASGPPHAVISERHFQLLSTALSYVSEAILLLEDSEDPDLVLVANESGSALRELAFLTGREYSEDLLDSIFSTFCLGK